ncbi:MAG: long-chain-fatty-acid--CoA ligase [Syntrophothermus sp.]
MSGDRGESLRSIQEVPLPERPWVKHYPAGVRLNLEYPDVTLQHYLDASAAQYPDSVAVIFRGIRMSYRELADQVNRLANALDKLGIVKGDRVSLMMPNCPQAVVSYFAVLKVGAIVVQTNPLYTERELDYQINDSGSTAMIMLDALYTRLAGIRHKTPLQQVIVTSLGARVETGPGVLRLEELIAGHPPAPPRVAIDPAEDLALLQYTGGTTGVSKGVMLTHRNLVANALQIKEWFFGAKMAQERIFTALPLFHVYGMTVAMNYAMTIAAALILVPKFDIDEVLRTINEHRPTMFPGAPTMYVAVNHHPRVAEYDISSIRFCLSGSAPLPVEVQQEFERLTGGRLVEGYGLSEASPVTHCNPLDGNSRIGTIGLSFPDTDAAIVDLETGEKVLPPGEVGELVVRGPQVMKGYWNKPDETAHALRNGWLYTGDIARMDPDGYFSIVDRKKDMIIAGGFNVYPRDVEEVLYENPKIKEAVVAGVPDPYLGETVKAYLVLKEGQTATEEEIIEFCRERMAKYKAPRLVEFRESLPKSIVGKILRRVLVEEERQKQQRSAV